MAMALLFLLGLAVAVAEVTPEVTTPVGRLRGVEEAGVQAFRGIPYAEAPVKELRWRPPVPFKAWEGIREASQYGKPCMQILPGGSEDCLYLNVYSPTNVSETSGLPCLVWIHGGGFEFGSGGDIYYNGTNLVSFLLSQEKPAVLVTMNYRLNVFGFLGSELLRDRDPDRSTGNYGIQDQRMALRWVQENIRAFGGDPAKVMIFGQSAGACSVSSHLLMPKSFGLYSRAIMESGGFVDWSARPMSISEIWFQRLLTQSKCNDVKCLTDLSAQEVLAAFLAIPDGRCCRQLIGYPFLPWAPTIDGVELTGLPRDLVEDGKVNKIPVVMGNTLDDAAAFFSNPNLSTAELDSLFVKYGSKSAEKLYLSESHASLQNYSNEWWAAERAVTDQNFFCPIHSASRKLASSTDVFQYLLEHSIRGTPIVQHSDDIPLVFMNLPLHASLEEKQLAQQMAMSWYHMAAFGHPEDMWPKQTSQVAPMLTFQVASQGGNQVKDANYRDEQCSFMLQWLNTTTHGDRTFFGVHLVPEMISI